LLVKFSVYLSTLNSL